MAELLTIPSEVRRQVLDCCYLPQYLALSETCRLLRDECSVSLRKERQELNEILENRSQSLGTRSLHKLLLRILTHQIPPQAVVTLYLGRGYDSERCVDLRGIRRIPVPDPNRFDGIHGWPDITARAVSTSRWIAFDEKESVQKAIVAGNEDAVAALLLPLLSNLRLLNPPNPGHYTRRVIQRIAVAQQSADDPSLPLMRLVYLDLWVYPGDTGASLEGDYLNSIVGLRALKRISSYATWGEKPHQWTPDMARPVCPEVYLHGNTTAECVRSFASGWGAPCVMWQRWEKDHDRMGIFGPEWQSCCVKRGETGQLEVVVKLDPEWEGEYDEKDEAWLDSMEIHDWRPLVDYQGGEDGIAPNAHRFDLSRSKPDSTFQEV